MADEASSLKKVAVLTGMTMVIGGAEISQSSAATVTQSATFNFSLFGAPAGTGTSTATLTPPPSFSAFDSSKGTLTEVDVILDSTINFGVPTTATLTLGPFTITTSSNFTGGDAAFDQTVSSKLASDLAKFSTAPITSLVLTSSNCEPGFLCGSWASDDSETAPTSLTLEYVYNPTVTTTPLPGALPLFAAGLAGLGLGALYRRRKQNRA
jgi:hypothetical protein